MASPAPAKLNPRLSVEQAELQRFVDAVRECLGLAPLHLRNDTARRDAACLEALEQGPTTVAEVALQVFGDCTASSCQRVRHALTRLRGRGQARMLHVGKWAPV